MKGNYLNQNDISSKIYQENSRKNVGIKYISQNYSEDGKALSKMKNGISCELKVDSTIKYLSKIVEHLCINLKLLKMQKIINR